MQGGVVIFPTETVYGIGASARDHGACQKIYELKKRPKDNPFILHLHSISAIGEIAELDLLSTKILEAFSPGPLTLILNKKDESVFSCGLKTIGVRIPKNSTAIDFISKANVPIAAPSANISGKPSITRFEDAINEFDGKVDLILRGSEPEIGIESTVVDFTSKTPTILRHGEISIEKLRIYIPNLIDSSGESDVMRSPGTKYKHYAPNCNVIILPDLNQIEKLENSAQIGFEFTHKLDFNILLNDNLDYMKQLYSFFIDCDKKNIQNAYCEIPRNDDRKPALMDRLVKASKK